MAEDTAVEEDVTATETEENPTEEPLGPAGVKALAAMKEQLKAARAEAKAGKDAAKRLADLEASSMSEQEKAVQTARQEASTETAAKYRQRIVAAEIRAAAGGKLADPSDAVRLIDVSQFELDAADEVDSVAVSAAIDDLLKAKPYLAAGPPQRFQGSADQGPRGTGEKPTLVERIAEAQKAGDVRLAMSLKAQQVQELPKT